MFSKLVLLFIMVLESCSVAAYAKDLHLDKTRSIYLDSDVTMRMAVELLPQFLKLAKSKKPVYLIINSPGGSVTAGEVILDGMYYLKSHGVKIRCLVTAGAYSMAFNIYSACSERYAFPNSKLMFHPVRIQVGRGTILTLRDLKDIAESLFLTDEVYVNMLPKIMKMPKATFVYHYRKETVWRAEDLIKQTKGFIQIVGTVTGLKKFLN